VLPFKRGAFTHAVPVRPVVALFAGRWKPNHPFYVYNPFKEKSRWNLAAFFGFGWSSLRGVGDLSQEEKDQLPLYTDLGWLINYLTSLYNPVYIKVLPVYHPSEAEKADSALYSSNVQKLMDREY